MSSATGISRSGDWYERAFQLAIPESVSLPNWSLDYFHKRFTLLSSCEAYEDSLKRQIGTFRFDRYEQRVLVLWITSDTRQSRYHKGGDFMQAYVLAHKLASRDDFLPACAGFVGNASNDASEYGYIFELPEDLNGKTPLDATLLEDFLDTSKIMIPSTNTTETIAWEAQLLPHLSLPSFSLKDFGERFTKTSSSEKRKGWLERQTGVFELYDNDKRAVFVEWRATGTGALSQKGDSFMQAYALAQRLALMGPPESPFPNCVGFIGDAQEGELKHGYIFEMLQDSNDTTSPKTLQSILNDGTCEPAFSQRASLARKIATAILRLHEVNWFHRGIHSENILFYPKQGNFDIGNPILSGFEYSRPGRDTVKPNGVDTRWEIYRWPTLQNELPRAGAWQIIHDIYSLGLLILELAHWKPLHTLLCLKRWPASSQQASRVRPWLIGEDILPPFKENPLSTLHGFPPEHKIKRFLDTASRCIYTFGEKGIFADEGPDRSEVVAAPKGQGVLTIYHRGTG